jgi:anti-sigma B factor antagonist
MGDLAMPVKFSEEILRPGLHKIALDGTLDAPGTMSVEDTFRSQVLAAGSAVIVDLTNVDFMSSYGLRMFLVTAKALHNAGGELHLAAGNASVMQVIRIAGYDTMFPVYGSVDEAIEYLDQS